ncbi:hypothetical protein OAN47_04355, partial [Planctomycetota bacterium]|nr:hypothetical protein [Planctomycetota bacterium]
RNGEPNPLNTAGVQTEIVVIPDSRDSKEDSLLLLIMILYPLSSNEDVRKWSMDPKGIHES